MNQLEKFRKYFERPIGDTVSYKEVCETLKKAGLQGNQAQAKTTAVKPKN